MLAALLLAISPYVFAYGNSITNSGADNADTLRAAYGDHFFWFRHDGASYIVRDEATLREIHALFRRQRELGDQQARLGSRQAAIGSEQAEIGSRQAALASRVTYDPEARERMRALGEQMRALGERMRPLAEEMRDLSDQMRDEGRKIDRRLRTMMPELIHRGLAREVER